MTTWTLHAVTVWIGILLILALAVTVFGLAHVINQQNAEIRHLHRPLQIIITPFPGAPPIDRITV
jgi:hypothetical protein